ncbi:acetyl-CoA carboxylase biotin carboxyl carrier protein [Agrilactobacillus fermenti]|uniref:acetyl-CoA carboxylase biotin carboxyl carrier protein n=1 Tax=Agrilactobacillus fermenti TaxID=2586909 RepID=UPI001E2B7603|nr:acetyl-CoA carboxylase biotin carboxyl carrier protein [Agrilactobacillus fermenti]MCD2255703.1 acetyl-CoA carboxylase biotin carboxyl carrier protein [Agrilactobacillus fermenti]
MDQETLFKLLKTFDDSSVREMDLNFDGAHIYLNKNEVATRAAAPTSAAVPVATAAASSETQGNATAAAAPASKKDDSANFKVLKAQLVGVVYLQPAPDKDNYVHVGDHVKKGQTVCVVEAMKMLTEVKSDYSGTIVSIDVNNEEMVDYDQPLMTIQPD